MAANDMRSVASLLMILNFAMYVTLLGLGGWAMNRAIDHGFIIGSGFQLPAHFSPVYFPMGNAATGFFVTFSLIADVVGVASVIASIDHIRSWGSEGRPAAASAALLAWALTLLSMGFAWKEIELEGRNAALSHGGIFYNPFGYSIPIYSCSFRMIKAMISMSLNYTLILQIRHSSPKAYS